MSVSGTASFPGAEESFITSWSGGKDACFAFWLARERGAKAAALFTMLDESGQQTTAHGLSREVLEAQIRLLGVRAIFRTVVRGQYEHNLRNVIQETQQKEGASSIVFGDIDLDAHKVWYERICDEANISPRFPLWHYSRKALLNDIMAAGFKTMIVSVQHEKMDRRFLGQIMTPELATEIESEGICPTGEDGEFHSLVFDGPCFSRALDFKTGSVRDDSWGHSILEISLP